MSKKLIQSLAVGSLVPVAFWFGGFNFDSRGQDAVACFVMTAMLTVMNWAFLIVLHDNPRD